MCSKEEQGDDKSKKPSSLMQRTVDRIAGSAALAVANRAFIIPAILLVMTYFGNLLVSTLQKVDSLDHRMSTMEISRQQGVANFQRRMDDLERRDAIDTMELAKMRVDIGATKESVNSLKESMARIERYIDSSRGFQVAPVLPRP